MNQQKKHKPFQNFVAIILAGSIFLQGCYPDKENIDLHIPPEIELITPTPIQMVTTPQSSTLTGVFNNDLSVGEVVRGTLSHPSTLPSTDERERMNEDGSNNNKRKLSRCEEDGNNKKGAIQSGKFKRKTTRKKQEESIEKNESKKVVTFDIFPEEMKLHILQQLPLSQVANCKLVNKNLNELADFILNTCLQDAVKNHEIKVTRLQDAVQNEDDESLKELLCLGLNPNYICYNKDGQGIPLLHLAVEKGNCTIVDSLLQKGAKVDITDKEGLNALYKAQQYKAMYKDRENKYPFRQMGMMLSYNDTSKSDQYSTIVKTLMERGAIYPLHQAIREGDIQKIQHLLSIGADIEFLQYTNIKKNKPFLTLRGMINLKYPSAICHNLGKRHTSPKVGCMYISPLCTAIECRNLEIVKKLLDYVSNVDPRSFTAYLNPSSDTVHPIMPLHMAANVDPRSFTAYLNPSSDTGRPIIPLHMAAKVGDLEIFNLLLEKGADINSKDTYGNTVLHFAAEGGNIDLINVVLDKGLDVCAENKVEGKEQESPLHIAARQGNLQVFNLLKQHQVGIMRQVNENITLNSLLFSAVQGGNLELIKLVLNQDTDINVRNQSEYTLLDLAVMDGNTEAVKLLLERGADVNAKRYLEHTSLQLAIMKDNIEMVKLLLEKGADVNIVDNFTQTPLYQAVVGGNIEIVKLLLEKGADINIACGYKNTLLNIAVESFNVELTKLLLEKGAYVLDIFQSSLIALAISSLSLAIKVLNLSKELSNLAIQSNCLEMIKLLVARGFNVNVRDNSRNTALSLATKLGGLEIVKFLLEAGADMDVEDFGGKSLLHLAVQSGNIELIELLITKKIKPTSLLPLQEASQQSLEIKSLLDIRNRNGSTPLHMAAKSGDLKAVKLFLEKGADVNAADNLGSTPLYEAFKLGNIKLVEILVEKGRQITFGGNISFDLPNLIFGSSMDRNFYIFNEFDKKMQLLKMALDQGIDINSRDDNGMTLLHVAALKYANQQKYIRQGFKADKSDFVKLIKMLVNRGADINLVDNEGATPLNLLTQFGNQRPSFTHNLLVPELTTQSDYREMVTLLGGNIPVGNQGPSSVNILSLPELTTQPDYREMLTRLGGNAPVGNQVPPSFVNILSLPELTTQPDYSEMLRRLGGNVPVDYDSIEEEEFSEEDFIGEDGYSEPEG